jgi:hypothetical protein
MQGQAIMRLHTRQIVTTMAATLAWICMCVLAMVLWLGISTQAHAGSIGPKSFTKEIRQNRIADQARAACQNVKLPDQRSRCMADFQRRELARYEQRKS